MRCYVNCGAVDSRAVLLRTSIGQLESLSVSVVRLKCNFNELEYDPNKPSVNFTSVSFITSCPSLNWNAMCAKIALPLPLLWYH